MRLFGLIGYPLSHSFSARYFNEKFKKEARGDRYENFPIESIDQFKDLIESRPNLKGLNVTIPYKEAVIPFLDTLDKTAASVGAVNTVCIRRGSGTPELIGHNTDVIGFEHSLGENLDSIPERALVLGSGGASKAVVYVLQEMGITVTLVSRTHGDGKITYDALDDSMIAAHKLIINTTPLGMYPDTGEAPPIPYRAVGTAHLLFDLVYNPPETGFLRLGKERGAATVNGHDMLVYQAEAAWEIWNRHPSSF